MYMQIEKLGYPKPEAIKVNYEIGDACEHKFFVWIDGRIILTLTREEAVTIHEKLGFAIQDYDRAVAK